MRREIRPNIDTPNCRRLSTASVAVGQGHRQKRLTAPTSEPLNHRELYQNAGVNGNRDDT